MVSEPIDFGWLVIGLVCIVLVVCLSWVKIASSQKSPSYSELEQMEHNADWFTSTLIRNVEEHSAKKPATWEQCGKLFFTFDALHGDCFEKLGLLTQNVQALARHEKSGDLGDPGSLKIRQIVEDLNKVQNDFCRKAFQESKSCSTIE